MTSPTSTDSTWLDDFALGHGPMDRAHDEFWGLLQNLKAASDERVGTALEALATHTREHFAMEDALMTETSFPARECHSDEHAAVLQSFDGVAKRVALGERAAARRLADALSDWFPAHADYLDSALAHWICKLRMGGKPVVIRRGNFAAAKGSLARQFFGESKMMTKEENELLCRVEGAAPMGQLMRQHWTPVCLIEEVSEPDGPPVKARVFGENLVIFRDTEGRVGVLDEACPHRRASLVLGRNEEGGLRCLYHGWKMDADGNVMEMASEPASSGMAEKVKHKSYVSTEWGGFVWAWFGSQDAIPEFRPPAWAPTADVRVSIAKVLLPCNWAQILEGAIDSAHSSSLHSSDMVPARVDSAKATDKTWLRPSTDKAPRMQVQRGGYGFRYAALRRPIANSATHDYVRSTVFVAPATALIPPNNLYNVANINVPMDDTSTAFYFIAWGEPSQTPETETWRKFLRQTVGVDLDEDYRPLRTKENKFWQDRPAMKAGNFTGISGFPNQDVAMWVTMGPIADRSNDRLGASDLAIVEFRRQMLDAVRAFQDGEAAIGTGDLAIPPTVCAYQAVVPKTTDWRAYEAWAVGAGGTGPELEPSYSVKA